MSPYRSTPSSSPSRVLCVAEPRLVFLLLVVAFAIGPLPWTMVDDTAATWASVFAAAGAVASVLALITRHRAWIIVAPDEERVRVVRLRAWTYSASTLRLSDVSVERSFVDGVPWLFVVAKDGHAARVLPTASKRLIDEVEAFVKSSGARPETPSPR